MRYFLLTIEINGNEGYRCNQIRKENFEIFEIENFRTFFVNPARDSLGMEKPAATILNNFYPGFKFFPVTNNKVKFKSEEIF